MGWLTLVCAPANTKHLYNICTTLAQCLRRWSNIWSYVIQMFSVCLGPMILRAGVSSGCASTEQRKPRWQCLSVYLCCEGNRQGKNRRSTIADVMLRQRRRSWRNVTSAMFVRVLFYVQRPFALAGANADTNTFKVAREI